MTWELLKKYSIILWYNNDMTKITQWVDQISMNIFLKSRKDTSTIMFWYLMQNKLPQLRLLFSKDYKKQNMAISKLLNNDFTKKKYKKKARKNAENLYSRQKYELCAAFYFLAGELEKALKVIATDMKDV